jgi:hypothetical protein
MKNKNLNKNCKNKKMKKLYWKNRMKMWLKYNNSGKYMSIWKNFKQNCKRYYKRNYKILKK